MKLIPNARAVLRKAWSIRLMVLACLLSGLEVALPFLEGWLPVPTGTFAALSGITNACAFYARIVAQKGITNAGQ